MVDHAPVGAVRESSGDRGPRFAARLSDAVRSGSQKSTTIQRGPARPDHRARPPRVSGAAPRLLARVTLGFFLIALPARAEDGGVWAAAIYDSCPDAPLPEAVPTDAGTAWLLPPARAARVACLLQTCETHRAALDAVPPTEPMGYVIAAAVGMAVGFATGVALVFQIVR